MNRLDALRDVEARMMRGIERLSDELEHGAVGTPMYLKSLHDVHKALLASLGKVPESDEAESPEELLVRIEQLREQLRRQVQERRARGADA